MDQIIIKNLKIFAHHGVLEEEKDRGQFFYITAIMKLDLHNAAINDELSETVNYDEAAHLISDTMQAETYDTIETAAENVARELLLKYDMICEVDITVSKPYAPVELDFETMIVEIKRGWHTAFLGIGSNLGNREKYLKTAVEQLEKDEAIRVRKVSEFIETEPYGPVDQPDFLNGAVEVNTILTPHELLSVVNDIENDAGRERLIHWGPRTLDIDILFYDNLQMSDETLRIPHPEIPKRKFVLEPLKDIAPYYMHPVLNKTVSELLDLLGKMDDDCEHGNFDMPYDEVETLDTENVRVVYSGVPGAYAEEAARKYFGKAVEYRNVKTFDDVVSEVASGSSDYGVIPIENSSAGFVSGNYDIIREADVNIVAEVVIDINHCLLGTSDAEISDIKKVYSHPQGIMQCKEYIEKHDFTAETVNNTALAARLVKNGNDKSKAAIASERAAELYGLKVLKKHVNFSDDNSTKFVVVSKDKIFLSDSTRISICFAAQHKVGSLYDIMGKFYKNRINMTSIESRPSLKHKWEYIFYVDFEGKITDKNVRKALGEIEANTDSMTVLGTY